VYGQPPDGTGTPKIFLLEIAHDAMHDDVVRKTQSLPAAL
jgi:hypothetical protein